MEEEEVNGERGGELRRRRGMKESLSELFK